MGRIIGFSTGCLKDAPWGLETKIDFIASTGADAIEVSFATPREFFERDLSCGMLGKLGGFAHVSFYAPWKGLVYEKGDLNALKVLSGLIDIFKVLPSTHAVMHPDIAIGGMKYLRECMLPLWFENMDSRKLIGIRPEEFSAYRERFAFGFVLDLQHVYEHDRTMALADDFLTAMGEFHLGEVHISGQGGSNRHLPLGLSSNRETILSAAKKISSSIPFISEGLISGSSKAEMFDSMSGELHLLRSI